MAVTKLMEQMAIAVLRGDEVAALALADLLIENRTQPPRETSPRHRHEELRDIWNTPPNERTRSQVERLRREGAIFGGCCDRHADHKGCDCLERAIPD